MIRVFLILLLLSACSGAPTPGPDKQYEGMAGGALTGAGAGMVTGFQVGAGTGPGAAVGAGLGAVAGAVKGYVDDQVEEQMLALAAETQTERARAVAHEILIDHFDRRMDIHPARDIYPADLFFQGDNTQLRPGAEMILEEIAHIHRGHLSWSTFVVAVYVRANDINSSFANYLAQNRSKNIVNAFVRLGVEPRRLQTRAAVVPAPVVIDPDDHPARYNQAVEFIALDK